MVSIIGRRKRRLGTGRVISQMRMQALLRPRASSLSGGAPIGSINARRTAAAGSAIFGSLPLPITVIFAWAGMRSEVPAAVGNGDRFTDCHVGAPVSSALGRLPISPSLRQ